MRPVNVKHEPVLKRLQVIAQERIKISKQGGQTKTGTGICSCRGGWTPDLGPWDEYKQDESLTTLPSFRACVSSGQVLADCTGQT